MSEQESVEAEVSAQWGVEGEPQGDSPEASAEERAALIGWREDGELSAEDFLARNQDHKGMLRENNAKLESSVLKLTRELEQQRADTQRLLKMQTSMAERVRKETYAQAVKELDAQRVRAVEEGDAEAFESAEKKKRELAQNYRKEIQNEKQDEQKQTQQQALEAAKQAIGANFQANPDLIKSEADQQQWFKEFAWAGKTKGMSVEDAIKHANGVMMPKQSIPGMEGNNGSSQSGGKTWAALPSEAKSMYEEWKKQVPSLTKEDWAKEYFASEG